jgi:thiamine pyrophosphate-dependent acetolactate synthase large subunit-like protein
MAERLTVAAGLRVALGEAGIEAVYGRPFPGLEVTEAATRGAAEALARAHQLVTGSRALVHRGDGLLCLPGVTAEAAPSTASDLLSAIHTAFAPGPAATGALRVDADPGEPVVLSPPPSREPSSDPTWPEVAPDLIGAVGSAGRLAVLAGPGVREAIGGLRAFATAASAGVLNTWGAKGVFHWRSRHHLATAGLQARDFELGGMAGVDLIVATGLDEAESTGWQLSPAVEVSPLQLAPLAEETSRPRRGVEEVALRTALAAVTQEGWGATTAPMPPSLVTRHYGAVLGARGFVAAEAGVAGYWVARTFSTVRAGSVVVPARVADRGAAVGAALVASVLWPWRPVLAVLDGDRLGDIESELLETSRALGRPVPVEVWDAGGPALAPEVHLSRLRDLVHGGAGDTVLLSTDPVQLDRMIEAAGPVVAWGGLVTN